MKKHKYLENILTFIILLGVFIFLFSNILKKPVSNLDELWNYNTARQIMNGLIPYKDISMITTPFLPTVIAIILKFTADELIVFRILTAFSSTIIIFMTYKILELLLKNKLLSILLAGFITYIYYKNFMLDYNFFVLIITLSIEYLELKKFEKDNNLNKQTKVESAQLDKLQSKRKLPI